MKWIIEIAMLLPLLFPPSAKEVVKRFYSNEEIFEKSRIELIDTQEEFIDFSLKNGDVYIELYDENQKPSSRVINPSESVAYENTIKLLQKKVISITKYNQNIEYFMADFGQEIVWAEDMKYFKDGYSIYKQEQLKDNWYYVKLD